MTALLTALGLVLPGADVLGGDYTDDLEGLNCDRLDRPARHDAR